MSILVVDDSHKHRTLVEHLLKKGGFEDILLADTAESAFSLLGVDEDRSSSEVNLILMDVLLPKINGIEACRIIKTAKHLNEIPIVMVTGISDLDNLEMAFEAGAVDCIIKPVRKVQLLAKVRALLRLKLAIDQLKVREKDLMEVTRQLREANRMLEGLSLLDGLLEIPNRRYFDQYIDREWRSAVRDESPLSILIIDIDHFKAYNDTYGHLCGDACLKQVASTLSSALRRPGDFVARFGGEEFIAVLSGVKLDAASFLAEEMRRMVEGMSTDHCCSGACSCVTVSIGVASVVPKRGSEPKALIEAADQALYEAKESGRNLVRCRILEE